MEALAATPEQGLTLLGDRTPGVFRAGWAAVIQERPGQGSEVMAASGGAPDLTAVTLPWLPLDKAQSFDPEQPWVPERWTALGTELAAAPVGRADRVVLLGRPGGPRFRASEVLRLAHLGGIVGTVVG